MSLRLKDTDGEARAARRMASYARWRERLVAGIARRAMAIHRGAPQDMRILCPAHYGGYWCQWVAGHYGGCSLARSSQQTRLWPR